MTIVAAPTAVPLLVGYTERAPQFGVPLPIASIDDFHAQFGGAAKRLFDVTVLPNGEYSARPVAGTVFYLEHLVRLFFINGGTNAYVLSLGPFGDVQLGDFRKALSALTQQTDVTLLAMPDAVLLPPADFTALTNDILNACAATERVFAVLDLPPHETVAELNNVVAAFRGGLTAEGRRCGAAYVPWLISTLLTRADFTIENMNGGPAAPNIDQMLDAFAVSANIVPPAALMTAAYCVVDAASGVWQAPANYSLVAIAAPQVLINDAEQATLNVDAVTGISIDAIRLFVGRGVLVWGARTLDGNDSDWRYVNVQRTGMMISASIRNALLAYVFMPNDAATWAIVTAEVNGFLQSLWQQGALQGATPQSAFNVTVGRGPEIESETMVVTVLVALVHPAEFVILRFEQAMPV